MKKVLILIMVCYLTAFPFLSHLEPAHALPYSTYMTRAQMLQAWADLETAHADIVESEVIGTTTNGTDIRLYKIGNSTRGRLMISSGTHGFEKAGPEIVYQFCDWLLNSNHSYANRILTNNYLLVVPILDIDGYPNLSGMTVTKVNLYRNFDFRWGQELATHTPASSWTTWTQYCGNASESEPETQALKSVWVEYLPARYIDVHVGSSGFHAWYSWLMDASDEALAIEIMNNYTALWTGSGVRLYGWSENTGSSGCPVSASYNATYTNTSKTIGWVVEATTQNPAFSTIATTHMPNARALFISLALSCEIPIEATPEPDPELDPEPEYRPVVPLSVSAVDEDSQVNLLDVPLKVSEALGIPLFASQILCSAILFIILVLPVAFLSKKGWTPPLIVSFLVLGTSVAIGWLPYWFLLILCMIVAIMFAGTMRDWITGK